MRLAMAQMRMSGSVEANLAKSIRMMELAKAAGAELVFFPEIQLSPFFPRYEKRDASRWLMEPDGPEVRALGEACRRLGLYASPNLYLHIDCKRYDASLMIEPDGNILGVSKMVHIAQAPRFYEQDYYAAAEDGFHVYETPFGKIGIVICFDRHIPTSIRACAKQGAELVILPTANLTEEPMELFEWEIRTQAFQNTVFIAMCNRTGPEGDVNFAGQSLAAGPDGSRLLKADGSEALLTVDLPLEQARAARRERPWLEF